MITTGPHPNLTATGFTLWEQSTDGSYHPSRLYPFIGALGFAVGLAQQSLRLGGHIRIHPVGGPGQAQPDGYVAV